MSSPAAPDKEIFYEENSITVSASWLELGNTSYAIRYLQKIELNSSSPPRLEAGIVFLISVVMCIWQVLRVLDGVEPIVLNWFLLIICVALLIGSSYVAFYIPDQHRLTVLLANQATPLQIDCSTKAEVADLKDALIRAMDWYRSNPDFGAGQASISTE